MMNVRFESTDRVGPVMSLLAIDGNGERCENVKLITIMYIQMTYNWCSMLVII